MSNVATRFIDRHVAANLGHKRAFDYNGKPYSYHDLAALANRAGNLLKSLGAAAGVRVLVVLPESPAYFATLIGAMKVGAIPVIGIELAAEGAMLAVVHAKFLGEASAALAALPKDKILVVGEAPAGYPSFVESMRSQPSSLAAEAVASDAAALVLAGATPVTHGELEKLLEASDDARLGRVGALLQPLARADTALLS